MQSREDLFKAIELEIQTQSAFFNAAEGEHVSNYDVSYDTLRCTLSASIYLPEDCSELSDASAEIFVDNMNEQLTKHKKKFGFRYKLKNEGKGGRCYYLLTITRK